MAKQRIKLQSELQKIIGARSDHKPNVYFQPPENVKLNYPCIIYDRESGETKFAGNMPYNFTKRYNVTIITNDPDSNLVDSLAKAFPMITLNRSFSKDNLNHDTFVLYY